MHESIDDKLVSWSDSKMMGKATTVLTHDILNTYVTGHEKGAGSTGGLITRTFANWTFCNTRISPSRASSDELLPPESSSKLSPTIGIFATPLPSCLLP